MLDKNRRWATVKGFVSFLIAAVLVWGLVGCGNRSDRIEPPQASNTDQASKTQVAGQLSEVAPPPVIQQLSQSLEAYQPQVSIVNPKADEVLQDINVSVQIQVQDLPIFKDPDLELGPHLHVILDNQPYKAVYDINQPLVFEDLSPGTHTLRVFASRPWHESFKNEGAYAQTTFHIYTKTPDNNPDSALPLLTYSRPTGSYGAEPIMLDFYLTNAPLHLVAQENPDDEIADWRIRVTINGESFVLDRWQPVYLKGFKPGKNWVKLEFLDEQGNPIKNVFNNTVRLINYEPKGKDTLSKLVRGELSAEAAGRIVDPNYKTKPTPTPLPVVTPAPSPSPELPEAVETPAPEPVVPEETEPTPQPDALPTPSKPPATIEEPTFKEVAPLEVPLTQKPKFGGFLNRFRRPAETPSPSPELPEAVEIPSAEPVVPEKTEPTPQPELSPSPSESPATLEEPSSSVEAVPPEAKPVEKPKFGGFLNRFRRPSETPNPSPELPEAVETPSAEPVVPEKTEPTPQPELSPTPNEPPATIVEPTFKEVAPLETPPTEKQKFGGFLNRFRRPAETPSPSPELPEAVETPSTEPVVPEKTEPTPQPELSPTPSEPPATIVEPTFKEVAPLETPPTEKQKFGGFFNRFRRPSTTPGASPEFPEALETPTSQPTVLPEQPEQTLEPEELVIPSEPPADVEEPTTTPELIKPPVEPSPVIKPVPIPIQPQTPPSERSTSDSGLPPTLPEIVETPFPKPSQPEAAFPEPSPPIKSELKPSQATAPAAAPLPESLPEPKPTTSSSERTETPNPEPAAKPKLDLKQVFSSPPTSETSVRIIQAPADVQSDIPSRFLKKSAPDDSVNVSKSLEAPVAN